MWKSIQALNVQLDTFGATKHILGEKNHMLTLMYNLVLKWLNYNHKDKKNYILYLNLSIVLLDIYLLIRLELFH